MDHTDVLVVGAGIHGAGIAQAAAAAGYDVVVLERSAPAAATSSRSSKLIHGGLRYLETAQLGLVRESLRERATLLRIAPDLVRMIPFHLPVYRDTRRRPWQLRLGLWLYGKLARASGAAPDEAAFGAVPREGWGGLDGLRTDGLQAVLRYRDAQTDDARLTRAVLRSARSLGATIVCPASFLRAVREGGAYDVTYDDGGERTCRAAVVVNAAGPWAAHVAAAVRPALAPFEVDRVQGAHIECPGRLECGAYYTEASDGRAVFVMPWGERTLVGTTETPFRGDAARVEPLDEEIAYLRSVVERYFPERSSEVLDAWAGLRVLPRSDTNPFRRSREVLTALDVVASPRFLTVAGGKLTAYRSTAQSVVRTLACSLPAREPRGETDAIPLVDTPEPE